MDHAIPKDAITGGNGIALFHALVSSKESDARALLTKYRKDELTPIISAESLSELSTAGWRLFNKLTDELDLEVRIVIYLRNILPYYLSAYDQRIKRHGEYRSFTEWHPSYDCVYEKLRRFANINNSHQIHAYHYDNHAHDVVTPFLDCLGIDHVESLCNADLKRRPNRSLTDFERNFMISLNKQLGDAVGVELSNQLIKTYPDRQVTSLTLSGDDKKLFLEKFQGYADWSNNKFFQGDDVIKVFSEKNGRESINLSEVAIDEQEQHYQTLLLVVDVLTKKLAGEIQKNKTIHNKAVKETCSFLKRAIIESRDTGVPTPKEFDPIQYALMNPDLMVHNVALTQHFINHGQHEGRKHRVE